MERLFVDEHLQIFSILFDSWKVSGEYEGVVLGMCEFGYLGSLMRQRHSCRDVRSIRSRQWQKRP